MLPHSDTFLGLKTAQRPFSCLVFGWTQCSIWQERIRLQTGDEFSGSQSSKRPKHAPDCLFFVLIPGIRIRRNAGRVLVLETRGGSWTPDSPSESSRNPNLRPGHVSKIAARRLRSVSRKVFFPDGFDSPRKPKIGRSDGNHSRPVALQRDEPANPVGTLSESPRTSALLQTSPRRVRHLPRFGFSPLQIISCPFGIPGFPKASAPVIEKVPRRVFEPFRAARPDASRGAFGSVTPSGRDTRNVSFLSLGHAR